MKRVLERKGSSIVLVEYLHEQPDPIPRPMNSAYLLKNGFIEEKGNRYYKDNVSIRYDGAYWWCFYYAAEFRFETIEELEKLTA